MQLGAEARKIRTLGLMPSAREIGQPPGQIDFPSVNQGNDHPETGGQMRQVSPVRELTHPGFQGRVEAGVFFTAFQGLSGI